MKEIWIVTFNFGEVKAGPVIRFMRYAPLFKSGGLDVVFFTTRNNQGSASNDAFKVEYVESDNLIALTRGTVQEFDKRKIKPAAIIFFSLHYRNYFDLANVMGSGTKLIYVSTMRLELKDDLRIKRSSFRSFLLKRVLRSLYSRMDFVVSSSRLLENDFRQLGMRDTSLKTIYNGVDTNRFRPDSSEKARKRAEFGFESSTLVFIYVGLFVERKGVDELLSIFRDFYQASTVPFQLLMIGEERVTEENTESFIKHWEDLKSESIAAGWLQVFPFADDIEKYYQIADAFVFMSKYEGMPNVLLESMSCALPVFTREFNGFSDDYGVSGKHFQFLDKDISNNVNLLLDFSSNPAKYRLLGENARRNILEKFGVSNSIKEYLDLVNEGSL